MKIGFIGLGVMGMPMALNLARAGHQLLVWNRSAKEVGTLLELGAHSASSAAEVFAGAPIVIMMLANEKAVDQVLQRGTPAFQTMLHGRTLVCTGTVSPTFSRQLEMDVLAAGGRFVEAPVSGSRIPAERGELVGMLAGKPDSVSLVRPLISAMCKSIFDCGAVPGAINMKLAVNLFLITMVTGLAEAANFAREQQLDMQIFRKVIEAGPMLSRVADMKLPMLVDGDFPVQASISDVLMNAQLVAAAARQAGVAAPLIDISRTLFAETQSMGHGALDMAAVILALKARSIQEGKGRGE